MSDQGLPSVDDVIAKFAQPEQPAPQTAQENQQVTGEQSESTAQPVSADNPEQQEQGNATPAAEASQEVEEKKEDAQPKQKASAQFASLRKMEKQVREREAQASQALKRAEELLAKAEEREKAFQAQLESSKKSPKSLLKQFGFEVDDIAKEILGEDVKPKEEDPVLKKLSAIEEKEKRLQELIEEMDRTKQQTKAEQEQAALNEMISGIKGEIVGGEYEFLRIFPNSDEVVFNVISDHYEKTGNVLSNAEACVIVEEWYEQNYLDKLAQSKKLSSKLQKSPSQEAVKQPKPAEAKPKSATSAPSTLTQSHQTSSRSPVNLDDLGREDAIQELVKKYSADWSRR